MTQNKTNPPTRKIKTEAELKEEYLSWLDSIKIRKLAYDSSKVYLKEAENKLKIAKKVYSRTYVAWKEARKEAERTKRKWKSYPYRLRLWAKQNWGKVFEMIEKEVTNSNGN